MEVGTSRDEGPWRPDGAVEQSCSVRLEITRRAELAVRALALVAGSGARWKGSAIAAELGTTDRFVPQVLAPLVRAGWLHSEPGPNGGYVAQVALGEISVLEVIEAVDGMTDTGRCVVADGPCSTTEPCILHVAWADARGELLGSLRATPLSSLSGSGRESGGSGLPQTATGSSFPEADLTEEES